ncbi:MAG: glutathione S-transferase N-terminal domain-containing protein [Magnetospirillum sp.]|nr:glutathione S-transferase N-terminal domain-containing protein [Magnetospirillum sp.]
MKLRYSTTSPYARKCWVVAIETGLEDRIEFLVTNAWSPETDLPKDNPLCKVPALITDGGEVLFDSPVICEYLDSLHGGQALLPASGGARWAQLRLAALADGILDAALVKRLELTMRPEDKRWSNWIDRQSAAINRALDVMEEECAAWGGDFLMGHIAAAVALGYLDLRFAAEDWRKGRNRLAAWYAVVQQRPSMVKSFPSE